MFPGGSISPSASVTSRPNFNFSEVEEQFCSMMNLLCVAASVAAQEVIMKSYVL